MGSIVLFDGVCNFCNGAVNFIIRHDPGGRFKFAPLQSTIGEEMRLEFGVGKDVDSIVLIEDREAFTHSDAALRILRGLGGIWSIGYAFMIIPKPIRDRFYRLFARYRYSLFGKREVCMVPTPDVKSRFLA
jgi:predicted DCC family thiol-disulfide oxidoreductase YuxK